MAEATPLSLSEDDIQDLRERFHSEVILPEDEGYDEARENLERDDRSQAGDHCPM